MGYGDDSSESNALTPASTSSFGHSVMSKRGKTGYDVQKSLSGLMLNSQPSAETRKPFVPPGQKRKVEEDSVDDDSLFNMYTAVRSRPKSLSTRAPPNFQRKASGTLLGPVFPTSHSVSFLCIIICIYSTKFLHEDV